MVRPVCLPVLLALLVPAITQAQAASDVARLRFLQGCWELRTATRVTHEQWMAPLGGTLLGMSRTVAGDVTRAYEFLRIAPIGGRVTYVATPSGQAETAFASTEITDSTATFENPAHDFPTRIAYQRAGTDSLVARISGPMQGTTRSIVYPMRRVPCAP